MYFTKGGKGFVKRKGGCRYRRYKRNRLCGSEEVSGERCEGRAVRVQRGDGE